MRSPTFVATFADGEVTRMSVYHAERCATLDLRRGIKLATCAYVARARNRDTALGFDGAPVTVPAIVLRGRRARAGDCAGRIRRGADHGWK
jgi:hypothetical protein